MKQSKHKEKKLNRSIKYGSYSLFMTILVIGILYIINLIAGNSNLTVDLTANKVFSLSSESNQILAGLEEEVTIISLSKSGSEETTITRILNEYKKAEKIKVEFIDPEINPSLVSEYQEDGTTLPYGSVIVASGNKYKVINSVDMYSYDSSYQKIEEVQVEPQITNAILNVTNDYNSTIFTLVGHNETALPESLVSVLKTENYQIEELQLIQDEWQPEESDLLLINGAKKDLTAMELEQIEEYLDNGGRLLLFCDIGEDVFPNLNVLMNRFGVSVNKAMVFENDKNYTVTSQNFYLVPKLTSQPIVKPLKDSKYSILTVYAQPIDILDVKKDTLIMEPLLQTSEQSYGKTVETMKLTTTYEKQENDLTGPFDIGMAITDQNKDNEKIDSKLVLFTSTQLLNESLIEASNEANIDITVNSINWLSNRQDSMSIRPKDVTSKILAMNQSQQMIISGIAILVIPLLIAISGGLTWYRRKNR
ncbi:GldG family protein [Caldibacillus lycopersici]|uniref:GldG family protein n=1 Tax=Perspicuibacillus lycopersici TaxID=1325689 RepID=A0AAE3ITS4_9BACI|nr:GldG family protein [Perspicuibacillus lycopersici]MCU9612629.1 GldG family protein [Perspicuibacillus lycopersici]